MNVQLTPAELAALPVELPVMTKREKLLRFAEIVRKCKCSPLVMFNNVEYMHPSQWRMLEHSYSAFAMAANDPVLRDAGLTQHNVYDASRFFELSPSELHYFSCDCGGVISNAEMANRIEWIAARA